jgi:outer membrane protein
MKLKLIALFFLFSFVLGAQGTKKLKLDEAIKLGQEQSKSLKISQSKMAVNDARYVEIKDMALPSLKLSAGYTRVSDITPFTIRLTPTSPELTLFPIILDNYATRASINESVFNGFRLKNGMMSQKYLLEASKMDYEKDKTEIIFNIINAYYNLYKVQASKQLVEQSLAQVDERLKEMRSMEAHGVAIHNDVLRVELQRSNIELTEIDINNNLEVANYNFSVMMGLPEGTLVEIDTLGLFKAKEVKSFPDYLKTSLQKRADLQAADQRQKAAELNMKVVKGNLFPTVNVGANYYYANPNPRYIPPSDVFHDTWDIGVNLSWDITALYTTRHATDEASAQLMQSKAQSDQIADGIRMEVNQDFVTYEQSLKKIDVAQRSVVQATENYRTTRSRYDSNVVLLNEVLDAEVLLLQANLNLAYARSDAEVAFNHLLKSTSSN